MLKITSSYQWKSISGLQATVWLWMKTNRTTLTCMCISSPQSMFLSPVSLNDNSLSVKSHQQTLGCDFGMNNNEQQNVDVKSGWYTLEYVIASRRNEQ